MRRSCRPKFEQTARHRRRSAEKQAAKDVIWKIDRKTEDEPMAVFDRAWVQSGVLQPDGRTLAMPRHLAGTPPTRLGLTVSEVDGDTRVAARILLGARETQPGPAELTPGCGPLAGAPPEGGRGTEDLRAARSEIAPPTQPSRPPRLTTRIYKTSGTCT